MKAEIKEAMKVVGNAMKTTVLEAADMLPPQRRKLHVLLLML